jgi:hypothetical protein
LGSPEGFCFAAALRFVFFFSGPPAVTLSPRTSPAGTPPCGHELPALASEQFKGQITPALVTKQVVVAPTQTSPALVREQLDQGLWDGVVWVPAGCGRGWGAVGGGPGVGWGSGVGPVVVGDGCVVVGAGVVVSGWVGVGAGVVVDAAGGVVGAGTVASGSVGVGTGVVVGAGGGPVP